MSGDPSSLADSGSEGDDMWNADHPGLIEPIPLVEPEPVASPAAPNIPSEGVSPEQVGRDVNGKSIRLKGIPRKNYNQYFCSLGSKQIPPQVRRESKKKLKYRKKMVKR